MHSSEARASPSTGAAVLVGYLVQPAEEHIDVSIMSDASHINKEVFHKALRHLFFGKSDFIDACTSGTPMRFPNGNYYMAHPHLLLYIADLPELALVGLTKQNRACPICPTKAESFVMRCQHVQAREMTDVKDLYGVAHSGMVTKAAVEKQEMDDGIHLSVWSAFWDLPNFNIYNAFTTDDLHQLLIGVFGRHLCGVLATLCSNRTAVRKKLFGRLHAVPMCTASALRALSISDFTMLTGAEWHSLACVFPLILVDFFDGENAATINMIVVGIFTSFATLMHLSRARHITSTMLAQLDDELDHFFFLVPEYFNAFDTAVPQAVTFHMINHFSPSTIRFGTTHGTTTALHVELLHKTAVKAPSKRTNGRGSLETASFDRVIAYDAFCAQFTHLALYHPHLVNHRNWGPAARAILHHVEDVRSGSMANDPRCPSLPPASAKYQASNNCSLPDCSDDEDSSPTQNSATSVGEILGENRHAWSLFTKLRARRGPAWDALADLEARFADLKGLRRLFGEYVMTAIEQRPFGDFSARDVEETLRYRIHNVRLILLGSLLCCSHCHHILCSHFFFHQTRRLLLPKSS
ncbi:hypothetical protein BCR44DRAFT_1435717 [Catenaria anguillulae PL171]|uniref:Uncharacterized protein n=1 Tax=Catenaria anguillulae PL171 TaxID=765915 RepID=A0A1Y2HJB4_9FUNG|nr:hypothetical protein BCR44DRAFT_1447722 [Catenaria anguillulae PL171]ORZ33512.1 hypothetical protein BCR44DRAFT_1438118 [Catenaria anguillulae PL171]ORZ34670.1 hypothetical protein BCR44DRAFT_1435565 [Catenaria anguillulae PL171]ORZ34751.1 hypothetical protein BCR44DRAFT_1435717 [Catenaria anguillulae PL171]